MPERLAAVLTLCLSTCVSICLSACASHIGKAPPPTYITLCTGTIHEVRPSNGDPLNGLAVMQCKKKEVMAVQRAH